jgi:hypothetical protein
VNISLRLSLLSYTQRTPNNAGVTGDHEHRNKHNQIFHSSLLSPGTFNFSRARRSPLLGFGCAKIVLLSADILVTLPVASRAFSEARQETHNVSQAGTSGMLPAAAKSQHDSKDF